MVTEKEKEMGFDLNSACVDWQLILILSFISYFSYYLIEKVLVSRICVRKVSQ